MRAYLEQEDTKFFSSIVKSWQERNGGKNNEQLLRRMNVTENESDVIKDSGIYR